MTEDYLIQSTHYFTKSELENTGANIEDINLFAFKKLVKFRKLIATQVYPIYNGITTGKHKSKGHPSGKAFDVRIPKASSYDVFKAAIDAGFKKIGIYWNGKEYSYHLEDSERSAFWQGTKEAPGVGSWNFGGLIVNPAKLP